VSAWLVRRVAASIAIILAVVTFTFVLLHLAPGRPFLPGAERPMDPAVAAHLRREFGLDQPLGVQYVKFLGALAHGDLGESFALHRPVAAALGDAIPNTLLLAGSALVLDLALGLALGVYQAVRAHRLPDVGLGYATLFVGSMPTFWLGLVLLLVFGEALHWFPVGGVVNPVVHDALPWAGRVADRLWHLVLPAATLGCVGAAGTARYQRAAMLEVVGQDYVRTARAKGLPERRVVLVHALRNALLPLVTLFGLSFPFLLTGAVLVETVFAWPGMGKLAADAIFRRDYPVVLATAMTASAMVVLGNLVADVLYAVADPRIRVPGGTAAAGGRTLGGRG
jgi:peptide/nickel transport system permease protein